MRNLKERWSQRGLGIGLGGSKLTNLRFAVDLLLMATSLKSAKKMLVDLVREAAKVGLEVHESKTKVIWNGQGQGTTAQFEILGSSATLQCISGGFSLSGPLRMSSSNTV